MHIDHICLAVRSIASASDAMCKMFGYELKTEKVTNSRQQVNVQFFCKDNSLDIKLIEPANMESPLCDFLKKGGGLHHVCFKVDDVNSVIISLQENGARLISGPEPGEAFEDELIAFLFTSFGLNVELIDTDKRRGLI